MVRVTRFPVGKDDGFRAKFADEGGEAQFVRSGWLDVGVRHAQGATPLWANPADAAAFRRNDEKKLAPIIIASGAKVN